MFISLANYNKTFQMLHLKFSDKRDKSSYTLLICTITDRILFLTNQQVVIMELNISQTDNYIITVYPTSMNF